MNFSIENESSAIVAREVEESERLQMLPRHFGRDMLTVEYAIFAFMRKLSAQYTGGYWNYYTTTSSRIEASTWHLRAIVASW